MKLFKKTIAAFLIIILIFLVIYIPNRVPSKFCIYEEDLRFRCNYIIVEKVRSTGCEWMVIDSTDEYSCVELIGNKPPQTITSENTFVCYVEFEGWRSYPGLEAEGEHRVFNVVDWDIMYPVKHDFNIGSFEYLNVYDWQP